MKATARNVLIRLCVAALLLPLLAACSGPKEPPAGEESGSVGSVTERLTDAGTTVGQETETNQIAEEPIVLTNENKAILYFNDSGHITNESPYNRERSGIVTRARIEASVREATDAGCDVFVSEIYGMVPWYPSEVYSVEEHLEWFYNEFGGSGSNGFLTFAKNGNNYLNMQIDQTHEAEKLFFFSYRMNDLHGLAQGDNPKTASVLWISKFFIQHPEYRIGETRANNGSARYMFDFRFEEVRNYKLAMIRELIENYDLDGILLDFLRAPAYFSLSKTTSQERQDIMTMFVKEVREMLDRKTAETGKEYYFGVTLPLEDTIYDEMGVNVDRLVSEAGIGMIVFWDYYHTQQNFALLDAVKTAHPDLLCYAMISQAVSYQPDANPAVVRYTTDEQFYTTAYLAYAHKADGISLFNLAFYRNWQYPAGTDGFYEPPFGILKNLKDVDFLAKTPQYYFLGYHYNLGRYSFNLRDVNLSENNPTLEFHLDVHAPEGGFTTDGMLVLEGVTDLVGKQMTVKCNGVVIPETVFTGFDYESPYTQLIGDGDKVRCWLVERELLEEGTNTFTVTIRFSNSTSIQKLQFISLTIQ